MTNDDSLRDIIHYLTNKAGIISLKSQSFVLLYGDDSTSINHSTECELLRVVSEIEAYYKETINRLNLTSKILSKTIASKDWLNVKELIEKDIKDIKLNIEIVKKMSQEISDTNLKRDILNITKEMNKLPEKCDLVNKLIEDFKNHLIFLKIYDYVYDDNGRIVTKILSCNFDKEVNNSIKEYFEKKGFIVYTASSGEEALQVIQQKRPQIAYLSDKLRDEINGLEVLSEIRRIGYVTKVIIATASFDKVRDELKAKNLCVDELMPNSLKLSELEKKIVALTAC